MHPQLDLGGLVGDGQLDADRLLQFSRTPVCLASEWSKAPSAYRRIPVPALVKLAKCRAFRRRHTIIMPIAAAARISATASGTRSKGGHHGARSIAQYVRLL